MSHPSWRLSFSLQTTLVASLLAGGVLFTVTGWRSWAPLFQIEVRGGTIVSFRLSEDGKYLVWQQGNKVSVANLIEGTTEFLPEEREGVAPIADVVLLTNGVLGVLRKDGGVEFRSLKGLECRDVFRLDASTPEGVVEGIAKNGAVVCLRQQDTVYLLEVGKSKVLTLRISGLEPMTKKHVWLSPCGAYVAILEVIREFVLLQGSYSESSSVSLLDTSAPKERIAVTRSESSNVLIAFDRKARRLVCADDASVRIFGILDIKNTRAIQVIRQQLSAVEFSPDDLGLLVAGDKTIALWGTDNASPLWVRDIPALTAAFMGNGDRIVAVHGSSSDGMAVDILDSRTGETLCAVAQLPDPWREYSERVQIDNSGNTVAACFGSGRCLMAYRRNFSERWYGQLTRPEVWVVLVAGLLLACIVVRRVRSQRVRIQTMQAQSPPQSPPPARVVAQRDCEQTM